MSGVIATTTSPMLVEDAEKRYEAFLDKLGIQERGETGLQVLREVDVERIVNASAEISDGGSMWGVSVQDSDWFGDVGSVTWDRVPELIGECEWVDEIVLGTTSFEVRGNIYFTRKVKLTGIQGTMFMDRVAGITPQAFLAGISDQLGEKSAEIVGQAYSITSDMDQSLFMTKAMQWMGDVVFDGKHRTLPDITITAKYLSTYAHASSVPHHTHQKESLPLHLRHPQPLPRKPLLPTTTSLGRRLLRIQDLPIPIPHPKAQRHLNQTRTPLDRIRKREEALEGVQVHRQGRRSGYGGG
jgi:hypothetical protein